LDRPERSIVATGILPRNKQMMCLFYWCYKILLLQIKKDDSAWGYSPSSCCWLVFERSVKDTTASWAPCFFPPQQLLLDSQILHLYLYPTKKRSKGMLGKSSKLIQIRAFHDENHVLLF
jgi:hypothetical protein